MQQYMFTKSNLLESKLELLGVDFSSSPPLEDDRFWSFFACDSSEPVVFGSLAKNLQNLKSSEQFYQKDRLIWALSWITEHKMITITINIMTCYF